MMRMTLPCLLPALSLLAWSCLAEEIEIANPSFEKGTGGYWVSKPDAASIDDESSTHGARSLRLFLTEGRNVDVVFYASNRPEEAFTLEFDAKAEGNALIQVKTLLHGDKPLRFWTPSPTGKFWEQFQPTSQWRRFKCVFGPLPKELSGTPIRKFGIYLSLQGDDGARLWLDNLSMSAAPAPAVPVTEKPKAPPPQAKPKVQPAPAASPVKEKPKEQSVDGSLNKELIDFSFPGALQIYEKPVDFTVKAKPGEAADTLRVKVYDFRDGVKFERSAKASQGLDFHIETLGYYRADATLERNGAVLARSFASFALVKPLPEDYYATPEPKFGVWCGVENPELLRLAGAKWTRKLFFTVFQKPDFNAIAPSEEALAAKGPVKVIECLNVLNPFKRMVPVPSESWSELLDKTGKEIVSKKGLTDVWETQNEPMVGENFHGKMADVVDIISNESRLLRKLDPGTPIAGICINPMSANQYGQIIGYYRNYSMGKLVDAVMIHPYIPNSAAPDNSGYPEMLTRLFRDLKEITGQEVPVYISEIGYSTKPGGEVTELEQAAYLARVALINRAFPGLKACVWHCGIWNDATSRRELDYGILRPYPKKSPTREPKPAYVAFANMARQTYNAEYIGELEFGRGVKALLFSRKGLPLVVVYSLSNTPKNLKIPLSGGKALLSDLCGTETEVKTVDGILSVTVDIAPLYISGYGEGDIANLKHLAVDISPKELKAKPGDTVEIRLKGTPLAAKGVSLKVDVPEGWSGEVSGSGESWTIKVKTPEKAAPGEQSLFLHLVKDGESKRIWNKELSVQAPIELQELKLSGKGDGRSELSFLPVAAQKGKRFSLGVYEDSRSIGSGSFETGKASTLELVQPSFGCVHNYSAKLDDGFRKPWTVPLPSLNRFPISRGFSTFSLENGTPSRGSVEGAFDKPQGTISLGWSEKALLLKVETKDKWHVVASSPDLMWNADSLQIGVAVPQQEMLHVNNDGIQETLYTSFGLMPSEGGVCKSWVWASSNRNLAELAMPLPDVKATWTRDGDVTKYSAEIPWKSLNVKNPRVGMPLKFSLLVNDADESKQRHWVEWYGGIASGSDLNLYGDAVLEK